MKPGPRPVAIEACIETNHEKVTESGCWLWTGNTSHGYAVRYYKGSQQRVHRIVYELLHGALKDNTVIMHICDVKCCINPSHLRAGTQAMNMADMVLKGRRKGRPCRRKNGKYYRLAIKRQERNQSEN